MSKQHDYKWKGWIIDVDLAKKGLEVGVRLEVEGI